MESEKGLQELRYSEDSDKRKKLDGFTVFDIRGAKDTNMSGQRDLESFKSETKYDLRKSLAWDSAFFTSPGFLESEELFHALNSRDSLGHDQRQLLSAMSLEPEMKTRIDECSVRKSLAWDNAFFTSEGVLNPEELSLVNQGFKKSELEELCWSSESNRSIDSDISSLASLEVELFEDIRKSMNKSSKASSSRQGRCMDMQKLHSPRKLESAPRLKFSAASRESDSLSSLKPPKILGRVRRIPTAPTKRVANEVNKNIQATSTAKSSPAPMKPNRGETCCHVHSSSSLSPQSPVMSTCNQFSVRRSSLMSSSASPDTICRHFCVDSDASTLLDPERLHDSHEEMGSDSIASRNVKPSCLRMPSPKIGFFDVDDFLVPAESEEKPHSSGKNAPSKVETGIRNFNGFAHRSKPRKLQASQTPKQSRNSKICPQKTIQFTVSGTLKSTLPATSKARNDLNSEDKSIDCLWNEKLVNLGELETEFGVESCAGLDNKADAEAVGREKAQFFLNGKKSMQKAFKGPRHFTLERTHIC
ncbi:hypothetical protein L6164_007095 [Bauhinia variegata]|uniref:Uncharacterized protein n=1 Tax=Bauhinia variegata TaxID=167791 RepID=A0ACB9PWG0_BAUVA|nr:hypothetical protein L6164_007095 [Bauhinia variegata]